MSDQPQVLESTPAPLVPEPLVQEVLIIPEPEPVVVYHTGSRRTRPGRIPFT